MAAKILDARWFRQRIEAELKPRIEQLTATHRKPGLAAILAGSAGAHIPVFHHMTDCRNLGIHAKEYKRPETVSTEDLVSLIGELNRDPEIDGIFVATPYPPQADMEKAILAISPDKDVDGVHPLNLGLLMANRPGPRPRTAAGIVEMLRRYEIPLAGKRAALVGDREMLTGPLALMLAQENAAVTICRADAPDLAQESSRADLLVAAIGRPAVLTADFIKPGAVVIDAVTTTLSRRADIERIFAGMPDRLADFKRYGAIAVGDTHPADCERIASAYYLVPAGGPNPMSVAMLMANTVAAAKRRIQRC